MTILLDKLPISIGIHLLLEMIFYQLKELFKIYFKCQAEQEEVVKKVELYFKHMTQKIMCLTVLSIIAMMNFIAKK